MIVTWTYCGQGGKSAAEVRSSCHWLYLYSSKDKGSLDRIWPDPPLYSWELIQQCTASGGSFFISRSALAWSGVPLVWVCLCACLGGKAWHTHKTLRDSERGGGSQPASQPAIQPASQSALWFISCVFFFFCFFFFFFFIIGALLTTRGWVFPHCSAEQSGHLVLTDTNTRTHRRKHTETHSRIDTQYMPPAAVANDVSPDLAKLAFCFTAWAQRKGRGFIWQCSKSFSVA